MPEISTIIDYGLENWTVKLEYNDHPLNPKKWLMLTGGRNSENIQVKTGPLSGD